MLVLYGVNKGTGRSPSALPLGELSPKVTERVLWHHDTVLQHRRCLPSPTSLRSATSPRGRGKRGSLVERVSEIAAKRLTCAALARQRPLALPLGELSPKVTERVCSIISKALLYALSGLAMLGHSPLHTGKPWRCEIAGNLAFTP